MLLRTLLLLLRTRQQPGFGMHDTGRLRLRVWPIDLDIQGHVNNGVYLSLMDLGRFDLLVRSGAWKKLRSQKIYPVVSSETITFRRSLEPRQRYVLETRFVGVDAKAVYVQQRFVVDGEIYAEGLIRGRFLRPGKGIVSNEELAELIGIRLGEVTPPEWTDRWAADVALPPAKASAPSDWQ